MADSAGHLSDDELAGFAVDGPDGPRARDHVALCEACGRRRAESLQLRELLAASGRRERRPARNVVPSAMMRLRLRRHGVSNANELLEGFAVLMRGLASLFSLAAPDQRLSRPARGVEHDRRE